MPTSEEIVQLLLPHLKDAPEPIVSAGQGCEGDPVTLADTVAEATRRLGSSRGTVNFNSNGSIPERIRLLCDAGMDFP